VVKRDGRLVPFEADKISRSLFAATERLGRPDAFSARELTDGIIHFLAVEADNATLHSQQIFDVVVKVVRELGQPALAEAFADFGRRRVRQGGEKTGGAAQRIEPRPVPPGLGPDLSDLDPQALAWRASAAYGRDYSLREVFSRDLVAAQADGLLTLGGLDAPLELAGCVLARPAGMRLVEAVEQARRFAGVFVALDGPEYALTSATCDQAPADYARELAFALRATGLRAVVNLNTALPPPWADDLAEGPLFAGHGPARRQSLLPGIALGLLEHLILAGVGRGTVRVDWHLTAHDFAADAEALLPRLARWALEEADLTFSFDRPRRAVALAEGLDRRHPALLLAVELHLPRLAGQPGLRGDPALFLHKLESLVRLALSAAAQKRAFLRRQSQDRPAFLLDQARLVAVPVGLEAVVRDVLGLGLCAGGAGLEFAHQILQRIHQVLDTDGRACHLECCVDSAADFRADWPAAAVAGLTPWDPAARPRSQLKTAGALHGLAERGTAAVLLEGEGLPNTDETVDLLRYAWQHTQVARLRLLRAGRPQRQLVAPWEEAAE
jgi:hypothetical protein